MHFSIIARILWAALHMAVKQNHAINQWWCDAIFTHSTQIVRGFAHGMIESCSVARTTKKKALLTEYSPKLHRGGAPFEDSPQVIERRRENKAARQILTCHR